MLLQRVPHKWHFLKDVNYSNAIEDGYWQFGKYKNRIPFIALRAARL
jgi:hypothetical protein